LLAVADGLGGQVSGEVASATAIRAILKLAAELSSWVMRPTEGFRNDIDERVELYSQAINREMRAQAESNPSLAGMATTLTVAYIFGSSAVVMNVGDSRSYLFRAGQMQQITRDHTLAQSLQDKGIPPEATRIYTNVLTRCFGTDGDPVRGDVFHLTLSEGDQILLCSDGLTDMIPDPTILKLVTSATCTKDACEQLVASALDHGGRDNITVVLATVT
jgi:protein phosphatase